MVKHTAFAIQFDKDTPSVDGNTMFVSFTSTTPVHAAICTVTTQKPVDCELHNI